MDKISAVLIIKNEREHIESCLESIKWVDEIVVVDDFSTDGSVDICKKYAARVFQRKFVDFSDQRNFALSKASGEWALSIDADEMVSPELMEEIKKVVCSDKKCSGYYIPTKQFFMGRWLKHGGWYPDYHLRLFKKNSARWKNITDEKVICEGKVGYLENEITHFPYRNSTHFLEKINFYSQQELEAFTKKNLPFRPYRIFWLPLREFLNRYVRRKGFCDGLAGFLSCLLMSWYRFIIEAKIWRNTVKNRYGK